MPPSEGQEVSGSETGIRRMPNMDGLPKGLIFKLYLLLLTLFPLQVFYRLALHSYDGSGHATPNVCRGVGHHCTTSALLKIRR